VLEEYEAEAKKEGGKLDGSKNYILISMKSLNLSTAVQNSRESSSSIAF